MKKALITGATGYLGQQLMAWIKRHTDWEVLGVSRQATASMDMAPLDCGLADLASWCGLLKNVQPDVIFHLASAPKAAPADLQRTVTVEGTRKLCRAIFEVAPLARLVIAGSAAEYGVLAPNTAVSEAHLCQPFSDYGQAKLAQTELALAAKVELDLNTVVARVFNVYGILEKSNEAIHLPDNAVLTNLLQQLIPYAGTAKKANRETVPLTLRTQQSVRDYLDIHDTLTALMALASQTTPSAIYNVGSGTGTSVQELVENLCQILDISPEQLAIKVTHPELESPEDSSIANIERIKNDIGWQPNIDLTTGLQRAHQAYLYQALESSY